MLIYFSLGSNLGDRESTIDTALSLMSQQLGPLIKRSSFYYSKPWGFVSPNDFCNLCAVFETALTPIEVLRCTQAIERSLGRHKQLSSEAITLASAGLTAKRSYSDRPIDIDLLYTEPALSIDTPELTLPHPLMLMREFVMIPLAEIC